MKHNMGVKIRFPRDVGKYYDPMVVIQERRWNLVNRAVQNLDWRNTLLSGCERVPFGYSNGIYDWF